MTWASRRMRNRSSCSHPRYRYYDYEFERYWHFFQVFNRPSYNQATKPETWDREFERRFGKEAAPYLCSRQGCTVRAENFCRRW